MLIKLYKLYKPTKNEKKSKVSANYNPGPLPSLHRAASWTVNKKWALLEGEIDDIGMLGWG